MCGIFALIQPSNTPVSLSELRCACSLMNHRGPDQSGYALLNNQTIGFGHNRLSIQDPGAPPQPLVDKRTGTTIIFNGEVYDHVEIGRTLTQQHSVTLPDSTDTSVILALYLVYGPSAEFFSRLNGEFAFVIWDAQRRQLVAVRDRFGIKPLYWYYDAGRLVFSSEIKAIASLKSVDRRFSTEWLDKFDPMLTIPQQLTFMEGVYNVLPGQYVIMDMSTPGWNTPQFTMYWSALPFLQSPNTTISYDDAKAEVRRLVTAAVKRRLVADRELCVYLSGGVDSTVVCGLVRELGHSLTCITIGFGDHASSEESLATKTAKHYSLPQDVVTYTLADTAKYVEKTLYHTEIPLANPHAIAKFRLSEYAREKGFVVALTGEGSDEILLGYSSFRSDILLDLRSKGGASAERAERLMRDVFSKEVWTPLNGVMPDETPRVRGVPSWLAWHIHGNRLITDNLRAPYADGHALPVRSLDKFASNAPASFSGVRIGQVDWIGRLHNYIIPCLGERVEMASSIEGRPPLLDKAFTEFALRLPQEYLLDSETLREKKILYDAFDDLLPPHIRTRIKQAFFAPPWRDALYGTEQGKAIIEKHLSRAALERAGVWSFSKVHELLGRLRNTEGHLDAILGLVLSVQILHALFIENNVVGDPQFPMVDRSP
ncbi:N-terminal nucleophile aminohydrolase [Ramaria rubella]|nr:N-terminal nucleophile aminohydrolase [Ramaria rubella]